MAIEDISRQLSKCQMLRDEIRDLKNNIEFHDRNLSSLKDKWRDLAHQRARSKDSNEKETLSFYLTENVRQQNDEKLRKANKIRKLQELENDYRFNECSRL